MTYRVLNPCRCHLHPVERLCQVMLLFVKMRAFQNLFRDGCRDKSNNSLSLFPTFSSLSSLLNVFGIY
jgi:hypothetical protein